MRTITVYSQPHCQPCKATKAPVVIVSTGDPETDLMWSGFIPDNLSKYTHSTKEAA